MQRIIKSVVLAGVIVWPTSVGAEGCRLPGWSNDRALTSPIWLEFDKFIKREYGGKRGWDIDGHAFGRVASAVHNDPRRREAFECLETALEIRANIVGYGAQRFTGGGGVGGNEFFRTMQEAAMGMHSAEVARKSGVRHAAPAESYFQALGLAALQPPAATSSAFSGTWKGKQSGNQYMWVRKEDGSWHATIFTLPEGGVSQSIGFKKGDTAYLLKPKGSRLYDVWVLWKKSPAQPKDEWKATGEMSFSYSDNSMSIPGGEVIERVR